MNRRARFILLISLALIAGNISLFFILFEKKITIYNIGYSTEARQNSLLAAQRFLKRMGIPVESVEILPPMLPSSDAIFLPAPSDVIVLITKRLAIDHHARNNLLAWVNNGGHVILSAIPKSTPPSAPPSPERTKTASDLFLEALNIATIEQNIDDDDDIKTANVIFPTKTINVTFPGKDGVIRVQHSTSRFRLQSNNEHFRSLAGDQHGDFVVSGKLGNGRVTIITNHYVLDNHFIGKSDHAQFLLEMVMLAGRPNRVWLVGGITKIAEIAEDDMPNLHTWLWQHTRELMLSIAILIAMTLLTVSRRFGPILNIQPPTRRRLLEHIQASGQFLWQHHCHEQLLTGMQNNLKHEIRIRHPGIQETKTSSTAAKLSTFVDMTTGEIKKVLGEIRINNEEELITTVRLYERLRKQL